MDFDNILLEPEQRELLELVVEASRNVARDQRRRFLVSQTRAGDLLQHRGLAEHKQTYVGDVEALAREGLINLTYGSRGAPMFDVLPLGFRYYEWLKRQAGEPVEQLQAELRSYIDAQSFKDKYPAAYSKWHEAQQRLWASESPRELTTIGHLCREAMQEFAEALVTVYQLEDVNEDKAHTVARMRSVLNHGAARHGQAKKSFLEALLSYWGSVSDLVQRQEHGAQREGEPLKWEDARRVVFQTLIVMYEIDRAVS